MTRVDLLRMQYRGLIADDATIRIPDAWLPILDRYLDDVRMAVSAGDLRLWYVLRYASQRHGSLVLTAEVGYRHLPVDVVRRLHMAEARAVLRAQHTCDVCGDPGQTTVSDLDGLCVRCNGHRDEDDTSTVVSATYYAHGVRWRYDPVTDSVIDDGDTE